jgi:hypothetical protein
LDARGVFVTGCDALVIVGSVRALAANVGLVGEPVERGLTLICISGGAGARHFDESNSDKLTDGAGDEIGGNAPILEVVKGANKPSVLLASVVAQLDDETPKRMSRDVRNREEIRAVQKLVRDRRARPLGPA